MDIESFQYDKPLATARKIDLNPIVRYNFDIARPGTESVTRGRGGETRSIFGIGIQMIKCGYICSLKEK